MADEKKTITAEQHLQVFALATRASQHYLKCREFERAIASVLGIQEDNGYMGHVSDLLFQDEALTVVVTRAEAAE